jgi:hypothetical protein
MKKSTQLAKSGAMGMACLLLFTLSASDIYAKEKKRGSTLEITTTEGRGIRAELLAVKNNRLYLMESHNYQELILDLDDIAYLNIKKSSKVLLGLGIGVLSGAAFGATLGLVSGDDTGWFAFSAEEKAALGAVGLGVLGLAIGGITGAVLGIDESVQVSGLTDEEKTKLIQKLQSHARILEYQGNPRSQATVSAKRLNQNKIEKNPAPVPKKKFSRFHLTLGPGYFESNSFRGFKELMINSQFADTKPGGHAYFFGLDFGSYDAKDYPRNIEDQKWYFKDIRVEYSLSRSLMLGLGYAPLGSHSSHGYRYIPIDDRYYSELYLIGDYTGSFYYLSGAWMIMPDGFLRKTSLKIGAAAGVSSARMAFQVSQYAYLGSNTPGSRVDFNKTSPAFMAFTELNYFFNRHWSIGLNADYKYVPVKLSGFQMSGQYAVDYIAGQGNIYESMLVECSGCSIDLGGYAFGLHFGFHF